MGSNRTNRPAYKPTIATTASVDELRERVDALVASLNKVLSGMQARQGLTEYALEKLIADLYNDGDSPDDDPTPEYEGYEDHEDYDPPEAVEGDTEDSQESRARHDAEPSTLPPGSRYGQAERDAIRRTAVEVAEADWEGDGGAMSPAERANEG